MKLGDQVLLYRDSPAVSDPLQPEVGFVTSVLPPVKDQADTFNVVGFTHHGSLFALMAVPLQSDYDPKNLGAFVTTSMIKTQAQRNAEAQAAEEARIKKINDEAAAAQAAKDATAAAQIKAEADKIREQQAARAKAEEDARIVADAKAAQAVTDAKVVEVNHQMAGSPAGASSPVPPPAPVSQATADQILNTPSVAPPVQPVPFSVPPFVNQPSA